MLDIKKGRYNFTQQMMYNLKKINGMNQKDGEILYKKE